MRTPSDLCSTESLARAEPIFYSSLSKLVWQQTLRVLLCLLTSRRRSRACISGKKRQSVAKHAAWYADATEVVRWRREARAV